MRISIQTGLLLSVAGMLVAQETFQLQVPPPPPSPPPGFSTGGNAAFGFVRAFGSAETVKGSPYSAEAVTETTQVLADGNRIVNRNSSKQYRDSEGRERREISLFDAIPGLGAGPAFESVLVTDPVAGVTYSINAKNRSAEKAPLPQMQVVKTGTEAFGTIQSTKIMIQAANGASALALGGQDVTVFNDRQVIARVGGRDAPPQTENLGTSTIEGLLAEGTRTRTVIPAGQMGNDKPIEVVSESWYSPDLKMTIMTRHSDPRMGETVFKLTNVSRAEPARSLFEVPAGYTVNEASKVLPGQRIQVIQREIHAQ